MDCTRVEELLVLFSGDDLDARQAEAVRDHLSACPTCQAQADELAASRAWLQATPPPQFDDAFYSELRQSVLRELPLVKEEGGRFAWLVGFLPQWRWQPVLALATVAVLLFVSWAAYRKSSYPSNARSPEVAEKPKPTVLPEQKNDFAVNVPNATPSSGGSSNRTLPGVRKTAKRQAAPPTVAPPEAPKAALLAQANTPDVGTVPPAPTSAPEMMRMEFQTADPNIRIIWLTPKAPATNTAEPQTK